jgi:hypothetical protein
MNDKAQAVKRYERYCPQKLRNYVVHTLGYECCRDWDFETLADEFGLGYMIHWNKELAKLDRSLQTQAH